MKTKNLFFVALFFIVVSGVYGQALFQKEYDGSFLEYYWALNAQQTNDKGYIIASETYMYNHLEQIIILKTDSLGNIIWTTDFVTYFWGSKIIKTFNGDYLYAGFSMDTSIAGSAFLLKLSANGNLLWAKNYGGWGFYDVCETADSGYIMTGYAPPVNAGTNEFYVVKTDINGDTLWTKNISALGGYDEYGKSVIEVKDGGYLVTGVATFSTSGYDIVAIRLDSAGNVLWLKKYGGLGDEKPAAVIETADSGFAITGYTTSYGAGQGDILLIKIDGLGNLIWSKTYGGSNYDIANSVVQVEKDNLLICGNSPFRSGNYSDALLIKTDALGNTLWSKVYSTGMLSSIIQTSDSGYVMLGNHWNMFLARTDINGNGCGDSNVAVIVGTASIQAANPGIFIDQQYLTGGTSGIMVFHSVNLTVTSVCSSIGINEPSAISSNSPLRIYPNPTRGTIYISLDKKIKDGEVSVFNVMGERVYVGGHTERSRSPVDHTSTTLSVTNAVPGIYFVQVRDGDRVYTGKVVVE